MATNLAIDDRLIEKAVIFGKHKTKKSAVTAALEEYIAKHQQRKILDLFGTIKFFPGYHYKKLRYRDKK